MRAGFQLRDDGIHCGIRCVVQVAVERRRIGADGKCAQDLPRIVPEVGADLGEHHVAGLHLAGERPLARYAAIGARHARDPEEVDQVGSAVRHVGALAQVSQIALVVAQPDALAHALIACVGQGGTDAQPFDLLVGLDQPRAEIGPVQVDQGFGARVDRLDRAQRHRSDHADARVRSAACFDRLYHGRNGAALAAPQHLGLPGDVPAFGQVVVELDVHGRGVAGRKDDRGLDGHRPAGEVTDGRPRHPGPVNEHMIEVVLVQPSVDQLAPVAHLRVREARILLRHYFAVLLLQAAQSRPADTGGHRSPPGPAARVAPFCA